MDPAYALFRPLLFSMDAEKAHRLALGMAAWASRHGVMRSTLQSLYHPGALENLEQELWGLKFTHPLGLAAGLDKDGEAIDCWAAVGFGFLELGTVTPGKGQVGNEGQRMERLVRDSAVVNRMGFPNKGAAQLAERLSQRETRIPVGANIGKAKVTPLEKASEDYAQALAAVFPHCDYLVVNVSSPNTPGLRSLQTVEALRPLLLRILEENVAQAERLNLQARPILLKIAPDLADAEVDAVADLAGELQMSGIIATNTTLRHDLASQKPTIEGGLSGEPLCDRANQLTRRLYRRLGTGMPIVGVGGIHSVESAYQRIRSGARLLQVYTSLIYQGPGMISSIAKKLSERVQEDGYQHLSQVVGIDA